MESNRVAGSFLEFKDSLKPFVSKASLIFYIMSVGNFLFVLFVVAINWWMEIGLAFYLIALISSMYLAGISFNACSELISRLNRENIEPELLDGLCSAQKKLLLYVVLCSLPVINLAPSFFLNLNLKNIKRNYLVTPDISNDENEHRN